MITRRELLWKSAALAVLSPSPCRAGSDTGVTPATSRTPALAEFERLQFGVSYHFSMNTFTGNDYETGAVPATTYNPTHLDVRQWIQVAHELGARYAVLTAKHMSGFCLWDAKDYDYDVAASGNRTDVVAAFVDACRHFGLKPGFYYCILDPHNEGKFDWDAPVGENYYQLIKRQLTELHSRYRNTFYQLLDITWKLSQEQRWELYRLIKKYSPNCMVVMNQAYYQSKRNLAGSVSRKAGLLMSSMAKTRCLRPKVTIRALPLMAGATTCPWKHGCPSGRRTNRCRRCTAGSGARVSFRKALKPLPAGIATVCSGNPTCF